MLKYLYKFRGEQKGLTPNIYYRILYFDCITEHTNINIIGAGLNRIKKTVMKHTDDD